MLHIAFLTSEYPHPRVQKAAGIGTSIKNLAEGLVQHQVKVTLFIYNQPASAVFEENGIRFYLLAFKKYPVFGWFLYRKHLAGCINKIAATEQIDVIEAAEWTGITAFMNLNIPVVLRLHGADAYFCALEGRTQKKKNYWFERKALEGADAIVSVSNFTAEKTKELFSLKKSIDTIYNGIDVTKFKPIALPKRPNSILYFGTIIRKKGVLDLAKAFQLVFSKNPEATMTLVGNDNSDYKTGTSTLELFMECLSSEAKKAVVHLKHMPYEEVKKQIAQAGVVVLPSHAEAFPMTWLEAMAMEKAMVTSNIGWANELMIDGETGYMVAPADHRAMASAILELLQNHKKAAAFGVKARKQIVARFSSEVIVEKNIEYYKNFAK